MLQGKPACLDRGKQSSLLPDPKTREIGKKPWECGGLPQLCDRSSSTREVVMRGGLCLRPKSGASSRTPNFTANAVLISKTNLWGATLDADGTLFVAQGHHRINARRALSKDHARHLAAWSYRGSHLRSGTAVAGRGCPSYHSQRVHGEEYKDVRRKKDKRSNYNPDKCIWLLFFRNNFSDHGSNTTFYQRAFHPGQRALDIFN